MNLLRRMSKEERISFFNKLITEWLSPSRFNNQGILILVRADSAPKRYAWTGQLKDFRCIEVGRNCSAGYTLATCLNEVLHTLDEDENICIIDPFTTLASLLPFIELGYPTRIVDLLSLDIADERDRIAYRKVERLDSLQLPNNAKQATVDDILKDFG